MTITIEGVRDSFGVYFFLHGTGPSGEQFCGSADDLETAITMAKESLTEPDGNKQQPSTQP